MVLFYLLERSFFYVELSLNFLNYLNLFTVANLHCQLS